MDFATIGSINNYAKNLKMQAGWNLKKQSGNVTGHVSSLDEWLNGATAPGHDGEEQDNKKLGTIMQKVYAGKKLTDEEKAYLQSKDPMTYQKLQSIEQEQKSYEQELKKCRSKEEVQRLKMSRIGSSLATAKSIENNPHISQEKKLQMVSLENRRCEKLEASTKRFVKSGEYGKLPDRQEESKAKKELHEAEQEKSRPETGKAEQREERAEKSIRPDTAKQAAEAPGIKREAKPGIAKPESPEARKVRRAKAKAAYAAARSPAPDTDPSDEILNVRA